MSSNPPQPSDGPPEVSVIMPVYNAGPFLRPAVESVIGQSMRNWELILIDDGSTDGAVDEIAAIPDARIRIIHQQNSGKPAAMNRALAQTRGAFYALQDADDLSHPERLARQVACLREHPEVGGVFCGHEVILDGRTLAPTFRAKTAEECAADIRAERMPAHDPTGMYRTAMVRGLAYTEDLPVVEGVDYVMRVGEKYPLMVLGECLYGYRVHGNSVTMQNIERRATLLEEAIARMRERRGRPMTQEDRVRLRRVLARGQDDNDLVSHFCTSVADLIDVGERWSALHVGVESVKRNPRDPYYYKPLVYAMLPKWTIHAYKRLRRRMR